MSKDKEHKAPEIVENSSDLAKEYKAKYATNTPAGAKRGPKPIPYTVELATALCMQLSLGRSLRSVCNDEGMPSIDTCFRWMQDETKDFRVMYNTAKQEAADMMAEDLLDIVDDGRNDWMEDEYMKGKSPGWKVNGEAVQRSKLRMDARIWLMSKMKPRKYGQSLDLTTGGEKLPMPLLGLINPSDDIKDSK